MDTIKVGAFLKELRKEHGLSQEQLADKFNVSSRSVSRWENGNTMPDISIMIELADFYDIDIRDLLRGERKSGTLITSVASLILYFITYFFDTGIVLTPFLLILASGIFGINTMLAGLQLKGTMSKKRNKKLISISITIWVVLAVILLIFMTYILPSILFYTIGPGARSI